MADPFTMQNHRILVIDDNQAIHEDFQKILGSGSSRPDELAGAESLLFGEHPAQRNFKEFDMDFAFQGRDGLALVEKGVQENHPYALAFVDVRMPPGWDGVETALKIWEADPHIQIVICSAYSDYSWDEMTAKLGVSDRLVILKKPFDNIEVIQLAHALAEKWSLGQQARLKMEQLEAMVAARTHDLQVANEHLKTEIAERARAEETLRQAQKMEALGQLAGGVAHDFNNLLTVIRGYSDCLMADVGFSPDALISLKEIRHAAERAAKLTAQLLTFSRKGPVQREILDLNQTLTRSGNLLKRLLGENIAVEIRQGSGPMLIYADPVMMDQIIWNLAVNARDAMPEGGSVKMRTDDLEIRETHVGKHSKARPGRFFCLSVSDTGCGIEPDVLPRLFEPFFTTKAPGKGTGMGLATVYGIVEQHEGWIEVESEPGQGTCFKIFLPAKTAAPNGTNGSESKAHIVGGKETILLVEDEELVRQLTAQILQRSGYQVHEVRSSKDALSLWNDRHQEIDMLLTDMILPGNLSGFELAKKLQKTKERLKIAYTTGYLLDKLEPDCQLHEGANFLHKPYSKDDLLHMVRRCLDEPSKI
jgi:signal transduction histidine kinase